jgi:lipid A 3-O-deacylase
LFEKLLTFIKKNGLYWQYIGLILLSLGIEKGYASTYGLQISYGTGKPDQLKGYRIALQKFWPWLGLPQTPINLSGYWDFSYANWHVNPPQANQPSSISILAASPIIRLQSRETWLLAAQPYLELGIGASYLSNNHLGHRNLGGQFAFQDLIGFGLRWSKAQTWSLSYHYLHYSNAHLFPPNQGIDVKHLFTLGYEFY